MTKSIPDVRLSQIVRIRFDHRSEALSLVSELRETQKQLLRK